MADRKLQLFDTSHGQQHSRDAFPPVPSFYAKDLEHCVDQSAKQNNRKQATYESEKNSTDKIAPDNADDCLDKRQANATGLVALNEAIDTSDQSAKDPSQRRKEVFSATETTWTRRWSACLLTSLPPRLLDGVH